MSSKPPFNFPQDRPQLTVQGYPARTGPGGAYIPKTVQGIQLLATWKRENIEAPDYWLREDICRAFQQFLCLRLDGVPAAEMIAMTADMWVMVIGETMVEEIDRERIKKGFALLLRKLKRWPQPVELLEVLPTRILPAKGAKTMEAPISDAAHARGSAELDKILESLT